MSSSTQENTEQLSFCEKIGKSVTESDAVHPRFTGTADEQQIHEFQIEHDFYCRNCDIFFAPTILGLRQHFKPGRINHKSTKKCIYCKGCVYEYYLNERLKFYHDCAEKK